MAQTSRAWVMDVGAAGHVAAGERHVAEYLVATDTVPLPRTRPHCAGVIYWRDQYIPVIDLAPLYEAHGGEPGRRAVVLAYQNAPGEPLQYGALLIHAAPVEAWVSDDMAAEVPTVPMALRHISRASFYIDDRVVPILDVRLLFAQSLPAAVFPREERPASTDIEISEPGAVCDLPQGPEPVSGEAPAIVVSSSQSDPSAAAEESTPPAEMEQRTDSAADSDPAAPRPTTSVVTPFVPRRPWSVADAGAQTEHADAPESASVEESIEENLEPAIVSAASVEVGADQVPGEEPAAPAPEEPRPAATPSLQEIYTAVATTRKVPQPVRKRRPAALMAVLAIALLGVLAWVAMTYYRPLLSQSPARTKVPAVHSKKTAAVASASVPDAPAQPPK
jgi:chemotaxis signal transduction protein